MKLVDCAKAAEILANYFPDEWIGAGHDVIHFAPPSQENFDKVPPEVRERLKELGVHYSEDDGFYGFC